MTKKVAILALTIAMALSGQNAAAHCCTDNNASYKLNTESGVQVYRPNATISAQNSRNNARSKSENNLRAAQAELALAQGREADAQGRQADAQSRNLNAQTQALNNNRITNASSRNTNRRFSSGSAFYGSGFSDLTRFGGFATLSDREIIDFNTGIGALSDGAFAPRGAGINDGLSVTDRVLARQSDLATTARARSTGTSSISGSSASGSTGRAR